MTDHHLTQASGGRVMVPTELAALAAGVTVATIRKWASRGKLTRYGSRHRAEYDLDELYELMDGVPPSGRAGAPDGHGLDSEAAKLSRLL